MQNMVKEFKAFIASGNLVMIAVAFILAAKIADVIKGFMDGIVNPIIGAIFGKPDFNNLGFDLGDKARVNYGMFLTAFVSLILTGLVLFFIVKAYNQMRKSEPDAGPTEVELLTEIRDSLRQR